MISPYIQVTAIFLFFCLFLLACNNIFSRINNMNMDHNRFCYYVALSLLSFSQY